MSALIMSRYCFLKGMLFVQSYIEVIRGRLDRSIEFWKGKGVYEIDIVLYFYIVT